VTARPSSASLLALEDALFAEAEAKASSEPARGPIFILGAPRTGSTILYQALAAAFELPYIANLTNDGFAETPIVGLSIQAAWPAFDRLSARSAYGKTQGPFQPSEGSAVMRHWFGGGHPSETVSAGFLPGAPVHMQRTVRAACALFGRPLLIKNAWNCFRIAALAEHLPDAVFIWIRRDIAASAGSDLAARHVHHGSGEGWNSATPRNVDDLLKRPYWEQVVENQFEFSRAISGSFARLAPGRTAEVWYEDLCLDPAGTLERLARMPALSGARPKRLLEVRQQNEHAGPPASDIAKIDSYLRTDEDRFGRLRYAGDKECTGRPGLTRSL
jgi:hypothetical protein